MYLLNVQWAYMISSITSRLSAVGMSYLFIDNMVSYINNMVTYINNRISTIGKSMGEGVIF